MGERCEGGEEQECRERHRGGRMPLTDDVSANQRVALGRNERSGRPRSAVTVNSVTPSRVLRSSGYAASRVRVKRVCTGGARHLDTCHRAYHPSSIKPAARVEGTRAPSQPRPPGDALAAADHGPSRAPHGRVIAVRRAADAEIASATASRTLAPLSRPRLRLKQSQSALAPALVISGGGRDSLAVCRVARAGSDVGGE